jgi:hypothetical protein
MLQWPAVANPFGRPHGGCSSMAEHLTVDQGVAGSSPVSHPSLSVHGVILAKVLFVKVLTNARYIAGLSVK